MSAAPDPFANVAPFQRPSDPTYREPPANLEAEQELLGAFLLRAELVGPALRGLVRAADFADPRHGRIFEAAWTQYTRGAIPTPITLKGQFEQDGELEDVGGTKYLAQLAAAATTISGAGDYARLVHELAVRRRLIAEGERLVAAAYDAEVLTSPAEIASAAIERLRQEGLDDAAFEFRTGREILTAEVERFGEVPECTSTGFRKWDVALGGGLMPGMVIGLKAPTKVGKSALLGSVSFNQGEAGVPHAYLWLEMTDLQLLRRMWAHKLEISSGKLRNRLLRDEPGWRDRAAAVAAAWPQCQFVPRRRIKEVDRIRDAVVILKQRRGIKGFMLDYLQLVGGQKKGQSRVEHFEGVVETLADVCKDEGLWCIVASQENAEGNVRWGSGLLMGCDATFTLRRDPDAQGGMENHAALTVDVIRDGPRIDVGKTTADGKTVTKPGLFFDPNGPMFVEPPVEMEV